MVEIAISDHQLPNLESVPFCAATTLPPLELKKHTGRSAAEWAPCVSRPSGLSDQRPPGAEGPPEEKELRATSL